MHQWSHGIRLLRGFGRRPGQCGSCDCLPWWYSVPCRRLLGCACACARKYDCHINRLTIPHLLPAGFVESLNPSTDLEFGYEIDQEAQKLRRKPHNGPPSSLGHKRNHFGKHHLASEITKAAIHSSTEEPPKWRWWGTDWHSLGYTANAIQLFGATIFWISTLCGLPGILPENGTLR